MEESIRLRELGFMEKYRVAYHDLGFHKSICIIVRYVHPGYSMNQLKSVIYDAFRRIILMHPALGVRIITTPGCAAYFEKLPLVELDRMISFQQFPVAQPDQHQFLEDLLAAESSKGFVDTATPLWRAVVFADPSAKPDLAFYVAITWHHGIGDGQSGIGLHHTLLGAFEEQSREAASLKMPKKTLSAQYQVPTSMGTLSPPLEEVLTLRQSSASHPSATSIKGSSVQQVQLSSLWPGTPFQNKQPVETRVHLLVLSASTLSRILHVCRENQCTLSPFLQTVFAEVLFNLTGAESLRAACSMSLRRFIDARFHIDDSVMGLWIEAFDTEYTRPQVSINSVANFWAVARAVGADLQAKIARGDLDLELPRIREAQTNYTDTLLRRLSTRTRQTAFSITNMGKFPRPEESTVYATHLLGSQSCNVIGAALYVCVGSVRGGSMHVTLNWQEGVLSEEFVQQVARHFNSRIADLVERRSHL